VLGAAISTASFLLLAFAHSEPWQLYVATTVMGIGIGFAFASMTNLIVEAVPREQTGVASGMNSIMRSIGSSIGSQLSASIIAGNLLASGLPGERGFTLAFALCAAVLIIGTGAAVAVPARLHRSGAAA
jgi:MFS family permease